MTLSVSCRDVGIDCDYVATGDTVQELVDEAARHDVEVHGATEQLVSSPEWREEMRALVRNVSRPSEMRSSSPDLTRVEEIPDEDSSH